MQEHRHSQRARTLRAGKILFNNKRSVIDCMVRNISRSGACLLVPSVVGIPSAFDLLIKGEAGSRPCKAVWYGQNRIGVEFRPPNRVAAIQRRANSATCQSPG